MRKAMTLTMALGAICVVAAALEGKNGYTETELFTATDVRDSIGYPFGFGGEYWDELDTFQFGSRGGTSHFEQNDDLAADADGDLFFLVYGDDGTTATYTGLVHYDGTGFAHLVQDELVYMGAGSVNSVGKMLRNVTVSPATEGKLTAGHPVIARHAKTAVDEVHVEIASVNPATAAETFVYGWTTSALNPEVIVAIDGDGVLFVLEGGLPDANGDIGQKTIRRLAWNGSSYDETNLTTLTVAGGITIGADGFVYATNDASWQVAAQGQNRTIYRIDPDSGAWTTYATVDDMTFLGDWIWDSEGNFWLGVRDFSRWKKQQRYVTKVVADAKVSGGDRISDSNRDPHSLAAGPDGKIFVMEQPLGSNGTVFRLDPGAAGGGGGKGKGKNK